MVCIGPCEKCVSGFHISASEHLARLSSNLKVDGRVVPIEEILHTESHLTSLGAKLCRDGFPYRTPLQIRAEMLTLAEKFDRKVTNSPFYRTEADRVSYGRSCLWVVDSDDDDDFMPSKGKGKEAEASSKGKGKKAKSSSKGKGG